MLHISSRAMATRCAITKRSMLPMKLNRSAIPKRSLFRLVMMGVVLIVLGRIPSPAQEQPSQTPDRQQMLKRLEELEQQIKELKSQMNAPDPPSTTNTPAQSSTTNIEPQNDRGCRTAGSASDRPNGAAEAIRYAITINVPLKWVPSVVDSGCTTRDSLSVKNCGNVRRQYPMI